MRLWGENHGRQARPAALVGYGQVAGRAAVGQRQAFLGVDLPDVVDRLRAADAGLGLLLARLGQLRPTQPALQRAHRGRALWAVAFEQTQVDQRCAPVGVQPFEPQAGPVQ